MGGIVGGWMRWCGSADGMARVEWCVEGISDCGRDTSILYIIAETIFGGLVWNTYDVLKGKINRIFASLHQQQPFFGRKKKEKEEKKTEKEKKKKEKRRKTEEKMKKK